MAELQTFRSALGGFNREDVVRYIEYLNNKHKSETNQLRSEMNSLRQELSQAQAVPSPDEELVLQLQQANERCAALEAELEQLRAQLEQAQQAAPDHATEELEAYRRAERAERLAAERTEQLYTQANGVLADATARVDETATQITAMANQLAGQINEFRDAVLASKNTLVDTAAAMYAVRPCTDKE